MGRPDFRGPWSRELHWQRPPLERPVLCPPSSGRVIPLLLALASAIPSAAAAQRAGPARPVPRYTIEQFMNTTSMVGASFSPDERAILVTSNQSGVFNAYEIPAAGGKPQARTHSTTDGIFTVGYLPHDRRVLYLQGDGGNENDHLYLLDTTGTARDLTPGDSLKAVFVDWTGDHSSFYYATDEGSEFAWLARYDLATGRRDTVERPSWDVDFAYFSKHGKYLVAGINADARTEIRLYEAATHRRVTLPRVPMGEIRGVQISPSERSMALYVNGSRAPSNLYVLDLGTGALRRLTQNLSPDVDPANLVEAQVVRFPSYDGLAIPSLLYRPLQASSADRAPAALWIHGGPGGQSRVGYSPVLQYLANHGYVVLAVNNRGSGGYGKTFDKLDDQRHGEADLDDLVWAKRYLGTLGYVDTSRVAVAGGSYGGYLTLAAVTFRPDAFAAGVDFFGISNWVRTMRSIPAWWESFRKALYAELGDPNGADSVRLYRISPLFHADEIRKPLLVLQGANDPRVLKVESDQIVEAVRHRGGVAEYVVFPDEGHGFIKKENNIKAYRTALEFLDKYVKEAPRVSGN